MVVVRDEYGCESERACESDGSRRLGAEVYQIHPLRTCGDEHPRAVDRHVVSEPRTCPHGALLWLSCIRDVEDRDALLTHRDRGYGLVDYHTQPDARERE